MIAQVIKDIDNGDWNEYNFYKMCPGLLENICDANDWEFEMDDDGYNGWEVDWGGVIKTPNAVINVGGSMYYGTVNICRNES